MNELVVISGKGGTGKTSIAASIAVLAREAVVADCDVDAADLHLVLAPTVRQREEFRAGHEAVIRADACTRCGTCLALCRFGAIREATFSVDPHACEGCGVCVEFCPAAAIDFPETVCGEWFISRTRCGPMVHARLGVGAENSGKLVACVRENARQIAEAEGREWLIVDGPPGIGCPVIASITGATRVLIVTEPTLSARHDMERVLSLARHFGIPAAICINKWDLYPAMADTIEEAAAAAGASVAGRVCYDPAVTAAQIAVRTVVEHGGRAAGDIRALWNWIREGAACPTGEDIRDGRS